MYNKSKGVGRWLLPLSWIYGGVLGLRHWMYDQRLISSFSSSVPTLCVGNLSLGGTGKTPMVEYLLSLLPTYCRVAVLSRGYGRKTRGFVLAGPDSEASEIGDEPLQIHTNFPEVPLAVDENRVRGAAELQARLRLDLILLDDAMQHRRIRPDEILLLTSYDSIYSEDMLLPAGRLRDLRSRAVVARTVVVTKCPQDLTVSEGEELKSRLRLTDGQDLVCCALEYGEVPIGLQGEADWGILTKGSGALVTGIANPEPLEAYLRTRGLDYTHYRFSDHHRFSADEIRKFTRTDWQLTTQKDYMRLMNKGIKTLYYLPVRHRALWDGESVLKNVIRRTLSPQAS